MYRDMIIHAFQLALVRNCKPCHFCISSFNISFTNLCCFTIDKPLNFALVTSMANIEPQPPDISIT